MDGAGRGRVLFEGRTLVDYGNFELAREEAWEDSCEGFRSGRVNGLLALGDPGNLFLMTGTYFGDVPVRVSLHEEPPPVDDAWQDVVEAPWETDGSEVILLSFETAVRLGPVAAGTYRARWCAVGVDAADGARCPDPAVDAYALELWPAAPEAPRVVRAGSRSGRVAASPRPEAWHFTTLAEAAAGGGA